MSKMTNKYWLLCVCLVVVLATLAVFWQVRLNEFISFDDDKYITDNSHVKAGLTWESVVWAFTKPHVHNWHPLTWLSHMLDCELYGLNSSAHHFTNLLFHMTNAVLLLFILNRMTGNLWSSAFVAAVFALHPLRVESVAWASERKDVLSTFFWMLAIWAYVRYSERPTIGRYLPVFLALCLGLLAKQMLVTLPFVLLLLDYWPLGRLKFKGRCLPWSTQSTVTVSAQRCIWEKLPFLVLSVVAGAIIYLVQEHTGLVQSITHYSLAYRIKNAVVVYIVYIGKMFWPSHLAFFYPPVLDGLSTWHIATSALLLGAITALVIWKVRQSPCLAVGWLWYLGTLVPVIGLIQVWEQAMADRYTYIPLTGILIMIAWGLPQLLAKWRYHKIALCTAALIILLALSISTHRQLRYWRNSTNLFEHALEVTENNYIAHHFLAHSLYEQGKIDQAIVHDRKAIQIRPYFVNALSNLGVSLAQIGNLDGAIKIYINALDIMPDLVETRVNLGDALIGRRDFNEAVKHFNKALEVQPDCIEAIKGLGKAFLLQGKYTEAIEKYKQVLRKTPDDPQAYNDLGVILSITGHNNEAIEHFKRAVQLSSNSPQAHFILAKALNTAGKFTQAIEAAEKALQLAQSSQQHKLAEQIQNHLQLYKAGRPLREPPPKTSPD
jgi:tetratricopeptide (TPR) repeat protein